jgi:glycerophosphoryl diester phosphodiesterase
MTRPVVVAHRGANEVLPEHTLEAYEAAIEMGADALECDVRLTRDHHLVCVHDPRVERTSDGRGAVGSMSLAELEALDWGSWKGARGSRVLTLERLLELARSAPRPVGLSIETKHPVRAGRLVEVALAEELRAWGLEASPLVRVMSFSPSSLAHVRRLVPALETVQLLDAVRPRWETGALGAGTRVAGVGVEVLRARPDYVARLKARGLGLHVWTVDEPRDVELCVGAGADGIITNRPDMAISELTRLLGGASVPTQRRSGESADAALLG